MVTLEFGTLPKVTVPDGHALVPKARLEVSNPSAKHQEAKGLIPTTKMIGKIMWVHPDLTKDEQWDSKEPKLKGKSYNVISVLPDDDNITVASLSDSKDKKHALTAQNAPPQLTGTRSEKSYLRQYEKTTDEAQHPMMSGKVLVPASTPAPGKEK